jgi:hypothetical protein
MPLSRERPLSLKEEQRENGQATRNHEWRQKFRHFFQYFYE